MRLMPFELRVDHDLQLRLLHPDEAPVVTRTIEENRAFLRQWLPWVNEGYTESETVRHLDFWRNGYARGTGFSLGIFFHDEFAGICGFHGFDVINRISSIGYWLGKSYNGYGIMTRSVARLLDFAVFDRNMNRIFIRCATGNRPSRAIPERLGFQHEGTQREAEWLHDHFVDLEIYSVLAREWQTLRHQWRS